MRNVRCTSFFFFVIPRNGHSQNRINKVPAFQWQNQKKKKSQRNRRYQGTVEREELGKGDPQVKGLQKTFYGLGLPLSYICLDLMLFMAPITLNTEHTDHCPGSRLANGWHTWNTNLNNTEKYLKIELKMKSLSIEMGGTCSLNSTRSTAYKKKCQHFM